MSDQLTRRGVLPVVRQAVLALVVLAVSGVLAGVVWEKLWDAPSGTVVKHQWLQDEVGLRGAFSGTGLYVLVAVVAGLVVGCAVALLLDRSELVTLACVAAGSVLAGWLMLRVGVSLGPDDPRLLAEAAKDGTVLPGRLTVTGWSPLVAFPSGALVGLVVVFFGLAKHRRQD